MRTSLARYSLALAASSLFAIGCGKGGGNATPDAGADASPNPQCSDGIDNDGDGKIDYPNDPGCLNANQNSETDDCPSGPNCPECANGKDDDGDGKIDYPADPGCHSAAWPSEQDIHLGACGPGVAVLPAPIASDAQGSIVVGTSHMISSCGGLGPETAYQIDVTQPTVIRATTDVGTAVDTVIYLRDYTCQQEIACNDNDSSSTTTSTLEASLQPGTYYLIVDDASSTEMGNFQLHIDEFPGPGAACDATHQCAPGFFCRPAPGATTDTCQPPRCSDTFDNDTDGKTDYPNDPGCASPTDDDETDDCPSGPNCPACSNGKDDDGDGKIDYGTAATNDPDCKYAGQPLEGCGTEQDPMQPLAGGTTAGDTTGLHDDWTPSCGGSGSTDEIFLADLPHLDSLSISLATTGSHDVVVALEGNACGTELACRSGFSGFPATIDRTNVAAGLYAILVDGDGLGDGPFTLNVSGVISPGGRCDVPLFTAGALTCGSGTTCNGTICVGTNQCDDGVDNDGDGKIDYPNDPGCTSPTDNDETDTCPTGATCPVCSNGKDDDGDGKIDYPADPSCTSAAGTSEACPTMDSVIELTQGTTTGDTTGKANDFEPSCVLNPGGPDDVYHLALPALTSLHIGFDNSASTTTWYDEIELLDSSCGGTALACTYSTIDETTVAAGNYYLVVDGDSSTDYGTYKLTVSGTIKTGASCEGALAQSGALTCASGAICKGATGARTCVVAQCDDGKDNDGDGKIDYPNDPGCTSPSDDSETDTCPNGAGCPACSNGKDDDGDGLIDYPKDFGCASAAGTTEVFCAKDKDNPTVIGMPTTSSSTATAHDDFTPDCASTSTAPDKVYALVLPVAVDTLTIDTDNSPYDTVLMVTDNTCALPSLSCDDNSGTPSQDSKIAMSSVAPGAYGIIVDGAGTASGAYLLHVNGIVASGATCTSSLFVTGVLTCPAGEVCKSGKCQ
jgi:hypothetical protein